MALAMGLMHKINNLFRPARLSRRRMIVAVFVAVVADVLQIPLQLPPLPEIIDVVAMVLTSAAIGFHVLLLPTFAIEFVPGVDMLPTWTACVIAVLALRRRERKNQPSIQSPVPPVIPSTSAAPPAMKSAPPSPPVGK